MIEDSPSRATRRDWRRSEDGTTCLLLVVVKMSDWNGTADGRRDTTFSVRSERVEMDGREKETVEGSESPGKDERRTLTCSAMLECIRVRGIVERMCLGSEFRD